MSGFGGNWNVGMHSFATALIAFYWARYNKFPSEKRDRLVSLALVHDMHEAVTGDILPMFKAKSVKEQLDKIQENILTALGTKEDTALKVDLKVIDLIAFLYEIKQVSPSIIHPRKLSLAHKITEKQQEILYSYCKEKGIAKDHITKFLKVLEM